MQNPKSEILGCDTVVVEPFVNLAFLDLEAMLQLSLLCKARDG